MTFVGGMLQTVKDILFPVFCFGCKKEGVVLCNTCISTIDADGVFCCPVCHEKQLYGLCCDACRSYSFLDAHIAATVYQQNALIGKLISALKYQYMYEVVPVLITILTSVLDNKDYIHTEIDYIIPIPLHAKRRAARGFNQAALLAYEIGDRYNIPVYDSLVQRIVHTKQQAQLSKEERQQNVGSAFVVTACDDIVGKQLLLIDDVFTTGSTMQAVAKVLRGAGSGSITGVTIARG